MSDEMEVTYVPITDEELGILALHITGDHVADFGPERTANSIKALATELLLLSVLSRKLLASEETKDV